MSAVEIVVDRPAELGEGPVWDTDRNCLWWLDIPRRELHRFDPSTTVDSHVDLPAHVGALALRPDGGMVLAADLGFAGYEPETGRLDRLARIDGPGKMNDGKVDPAGRFLAGSLVPETEAGTATLYRWDGEVSTVLAGVTISNGLDWSPDGGTLYYVDTPVEQVWAFGYDPVTGAVSDRRVFADLRDVPGRPDGLTVDADGGVWVAMARGGAAVRRFDPAGRPDGQVELPVPHATSVAFGGPGLADLYVTTSRLRLRPGEHPLAGVLLRVTGLGHSGRPPHRVRTPAG